MLRANGVNRFLTQFLISSSIYNNDYPLRYLKNFTKCIHSLHQSKPPNSVKQFTGNSRKPAKSRTKKHAEDPKVYMRNTISNIYRILKYSTWDTAKEQLTELRIKWDSYTVNQVLKSHPPMEKAWLFFNWASSVKGFKHDQFTYTTMLDIFGEAGRIESMKFVFKQMQEKGVKIDSVTYTSFMHWVSSSGDVDEAVKIWGEMKENGCYPTVVSYTAFMKILFDNKRVKEASDAYKEMLESGISPNCRTYTVLMEYLVAAGKCQEALEIFSKMQEAGVQPDKPLCNILIARCCETGETDTMLQILQYMRTNYLTLRYPIFLQALKTLRIAGVNDTLLFQANPHCATDAIETTDHSISGEFFDRGLLLILLKKQNLVWVDRFLAELMNKNMFMDSWIVSTIIVENCNRCRTDSALLGFEYSMRMGIDLERTAYVSFIGILIRSNNFVKIVEIVKEMITAGYSLGLYLGALLIYRLGCARRPTCASKIFNFLHDEEKCSATYTAMISVYFSAGSPEKAVKIYRTMKNKGINPCLGTYDVLISGFERRGRLSETDVYRKEKKSLIAHGYCSDSVSEEEKMCDLLFSGGSVQRAGSEGGCRSGRSEQ
ncbi:pentatricopeptide repeat-containing protein At2g01390 [Euphorbia lathyris]|uniref:pentatricopeptide repeat-containing protein At2g01390 n=1 Tax=Euphorbia lathyris TaxID=212925 RepID=UPI003313B5D8